MKPFHPSCFAAVVAALTVAIAGCATNPSPATGSADPNRFLIVDCLLPPQVRQLGRVATYLTARRPIKASAAECAAVGGEFIVATQASPSSALAVWLPAAEAGDPQAQTYVGELFEKGVNGQPDYATASQWFAKASTQGFSRAQIHMGRFYEKGLHGERDPVKALNLYRAAAGVSGDDLVFSSLMAPATVQPAVMRTVVADDASRQEAAALRDELARTQRELDAQRQQLAANQAELARTRAAWDQQQANRPPTQPTTDPQSDELATRLAAQEAELRLKNQQLGFFETELAARQQQLSDAQRRETQLRQERDAATREKMALSTQLTDLQRQMQQAETQLTARRAALEEQRQAATATQQQLAQEQLRGGSAAELAALRAELAQKTSTLAATQGQISALEAEMNRGQAALTAAVQRADRLQVNVTEQTRRAAQLEQQLAALQQQRSASERELQQLRERQKAQETALREAEQALMKAPAPTAATSGDADALKQKLGERNVQLADTQMRILELEADLAKQQAAVKAAQQRSRQLESAASEAALLRQQLADLQQATREQLAVYQTAAKEQERSQGLIKTVLTQQPADSAEAVRLRAQLAQKDQVLERTRQQVALLTNEVALRQEKIDTMAQAPAPLPAPTGPMLALRGSGTAPAPTGTAPSAGGLLPVVMPAPIAPKTATAVDFGNYFALVIGNSRYSQLAPLETPAKDANAVGEVLRSRYGFKVQVLTDVNRGDILAALDAYRQTLKETDNFLLFYAGHGAIQGEQGFWQATDAVPDQPDTWLSNAQVTNVISVMNAKHVLVIADSCYSGTLAPGATSFIEGTKTPALQQKWLEAMTQARSRTVLTSTALAPVLDAGGRGGHSVFAGELLAALRDNGAVLPIPDLYRRITQPVQVASARLNAPQTPLYAPIQNAGHELAPFFLVAR